MKISAIIIATYFLVSQSTPTYTIKMFDRQRASARDILRKRGLIGGK